MQYPVIYAVFWLLNLHDSFSRYRASQAYSYTPASMEFTGPFPLCGSGSVYQDCTGSLEYMMYFTCAYHVAAQLFYSFIQYYKCDPQDFNGKYASYRVPPSCIYTIETRVK